MHNKQAKIETTTLTRPWFVNPNSTHPALLTLASSRIICFSIAKSQRFYNYTVCISAKASTSRGGVVYFPFRTNLTHFRLPPITQPLSLFVQWATFIQHRRDDNENIWERKISRFFGWIRNKFVLRSYLAATWFRSN